MNNKRAVLPVVNQIKRSKTSKWRALTLLTLTLLMIFHYVQWLIHGTTISPIEPSEAMYTIQRGTINAGFIFFALAILSTLIFGRYICGWGCHIVALQDLCAWLLNKIGLKPRQFRSRLLAFVPLLAALYMFVYPTVVRFFVKPISQPLFPEFTNHIITQDYWATFPSFWVAIPFLIICGFATVYFLGSKGFCTYACPYGGFFEIADRFAPGRIHVNDNCNQCGHCTAVCTSNVLVHSDVKQYGMIVDSGCMKCMDCVSVCPNDALYFGFGKPSAAVKKKESKNYPLSWKAEIFVAAAFLVSLFAVWDVYQLVPMLMALGIAIITAFLAYKLVKLFGKADSSFYKTALKLNGKITPKAWIFILFAYLWLGLNVHSGFIRYNESVGAAAYDQIQIPDELALAQSDPTDWLDKKVRAKVAEGTSALDNAHKFGFFTNNFALPKLAWLKFLSGDAESAVNLLSEAAKHQTGQAKALSFYYRGAILNRLGKNDEAVASLDLALAERSDLVTALEEKGVAQWKKGQNAEAILTWKTALQQNPNLPLTNKFLANAVTDETEQKNYSSAADKMIPQDPFFHWMLGLRLQDLNMTAAAERHFQMAIRLNPNFAARNR